MFKGLALGAPYVNFIGIGRAAMAAAIVGKNVGDSIKVGVISKENQKYGDSIDEIFGEARKLKGLYGPDIADISTGAIGLYSYINRISAGLKQLMALNRKFLIEYIDRTDIVPLTELASKTTGLETYEDIVERELKKL